MYLVRMPPARPTKGCALRGHPLGVVVLSQRVKENYGMQLLEESAAGVG